MNLVLKVRLFGASLMGGLGWFFGAAAGVAAFGTAVSGAVVFGPIAALLGFVLSPSIMDKVAARHQAKGNKK